MTTRTHVQQFSEKTLQQVQLDSARAMRRGRFCPERSEILRFRCVDNVPENEHEFGTQLWYFEAIGVDDMARRHMLYGVVEYSLQFGLNELVEDGVFTTEQQRERFRSLYERESFEPTFRQPAHRLLALGVVTVSLAWISYILFLNP